VRAAVPIVGVVIFGGAILALQRFVRCPKCKARLGQTIAMPVAFSWGSGPRSTSAPFAGSISMSRSPARRVRPSRSIRFNSGRHRCRDDRSAPETGSAA
jgi:hypothetical protein